METLAHYLYLSDTFQNFEIAFYRFFAFVKWIVEVWDYGKNDGTYLKVSAQRETLIQGYSPHVGLSWPSPMLGIL